MKSYKTVDSYIESCNHFKDIAQLLRNMLNQTELSETVKWGSPVYTLKHKNVVGMGEFKNFFSIWFYQGVFLKDPYKCLINAQEGVTKGLRQWRFTNYDDFIKSQKVIKEYIKEAIENQKQGKMIKPDQNKKEINIPDLLKKALEKDKNLNTHFANFSMSKQREFCEYIETAKREETKVKRLEKIKPMILEEMGLNDKYR